MHLYICASPDTTHCHQVVLVLLEDIDGARSTSREAVCSFATPNAAEALAV